MSSDQDLRDNPTAIAANLDSIANELAASRETIRNLEQGTPLSQDSLNEINALAAELRARTDALVTP